MLGLLPGPAAAREVPGAWKKSPVRDGQGTSGFRWCSHLLVFGQVGLLEFVQGLAHDLGQADEGDKVGEGHEAVEHVGQFPHQVHLQQGTHDDEAHHHQAVGGHAAGPEQVLDVLLTEEVPAHDGGEGEEEQTEAYDGSFRKRNSQGAD